MPKKEKQVMIRMSSEMFDAIRAIANADEETVSVILRRLLKRGLEKSGAT